MSSFRTSLLAAAALLVSGAAQSATITYGGTGLAPNGSIGVSQRSTNFNVSVSLPKFDTTLGTLTGIQFVLGGTVVSGIRFENRNPAPRSVSATAQAQETLTRPDGSTLVVNLPTQTITVSEGAYDGTLDFLGTSGSSFTGANAISGSLSTTSALLTAPSDLALFSQSGGGVILLPVLGVAQSAVNGGGNVTQSITTQASAQVLVQYTYNVAPPVGVPEPATMAILGVSLIGLGAARRRLS